MLTSYHVHTTRSDGEAAASDFVDAAVRIGLDELGISDHYVLLPAGKSAGWSMALDELPAYVAEIAELRGRVRGKLVVRCGLEADFDAATAAELGDILRAYPFDYVIGSVHFVDGFPVDKCKEEWDAITQPERNDIVLGYLDRIALMARSRLFDFVGHFDLYKKFGYLPTVDVSAETAGALDAVAAAGMPVEINTAGLYKDIREAYPSEAILRECARRSIPVVITADAHLPEHLTRGYAEASELARRAGCDRVAVYENRRVVL
jgi:histidinol-phosphatase (PHP family)